MTHFKDGWLRTRGKNKKLFTTVSDQDEGVGPLDDSYIPPRVNPGTTSKARTGESGHSAHSSSLSTMSE